MDKEKKKRGGKRPGAGRPKIDDKKKTVMLYIRQSIIEAHGGERYLKQFIQKAIKSQTEYNE